MKLLTLLVPESVRDGAKRYRVRLQQCLAVAAAGSVVAGLALLSREDVSPLAGLGFGNPEVAVPHVAETVPDDLEDLLVKARQLQGGSDFSDRFSGFRKTGMLARVAGEDGETETLRADYLFKRPDLVLYRLAAGESGVRLGFDGREAWVQPFFGGWHADAAILSAEEAADLRLLADFARPAAVFLADHERLTYGGEETIDGLSHYIITHRSLNGVERRFYFHRATHLLRKRSQVAEIEGMPTVVDIFYSDYKLSGGLLLPHREERFYGGEAEAVFEIENLQINPGIFTHSFEIPVSDDSEPFGRYARTRI